RSEAGPLRSHVATSDQLIQQMFLRLFGNPMVLYITAGILGLMGLIPGMPNLVFLLLAAILGAGAWMMQKHQLEQQQQASEPNDEVLAAADSAASEASWNDVSMVDPLGLEVGYRLISLVDHAQ